MKPLALSFALVTLGCSCKTDNNAFPPIDIDNGSCGDQLRFTGEVVNWDSNDTTFCGVFNATFQVQPDGAMDSTAPNGRFDLCIPKAAATTSVLVTPAANSSMCSGSVFSHPEMVIANREVIEAGGDFSTRLFTDERQVTFYAQIGAAYDPAKAQLLVHDFGALRALKITAAHDATQAYSTTAAAWAAGDTGYYVFFPNVDPSAGMTKLTATGGAAGTGDVPLAAGQMTSISIYGR